MRTTNPLHVLRTRGPSAALAALGIYQPDEKTVMGLLLAWESAEECLDQESQRFVVGLPRLPLWRTPFTCFATWILALLEQRCGLAIDARLLVGEGQLPEVILEAAEELHRCGQSTGQLLQQIEAPKNPHYWTHEWFKRLVKLHLAGDRPREAIAAAHHSGSPHEVVARLMDLARRTDWAPALQQEARGRAIAICKATRDSKLRKKMRQLVDANASTTDRSERRFQESLLQTPMDDSALEEAIALARTCARPSGRAHRLAAIAERLPVSAQKAAICGEAVLAFLIDDPNELMNYTTVCNCCSPYLARLCKLRDHSGDAAGARESVAAVMDYYADLHERLRLDPVQLPGGPTLAELEGWRDRS